MPQYLDDPECLHWTVGRSSGVVDKIRDISYPNISIQGELVGSSILDNTMKYPEGEHEFIVHGIWNFDSGRFIGTKEVVKICKSLGIQHVPVVRNARICDIAHTKEELLRMVDSLDPGKYGGIKEGWVFRSLDGNEQFKVISNRWLELTEN